MEAELRAAGFRLVAGTDEVGRGALAGPLVTAAVILPDDFDLPGLRDSKLCTRRQRERLSVEIRRQAIAFSLVRVTPRIVDRRGLHITNMWALRRAISKLRPKPDYVLSDGFRLKWLRVPSLSVKKGDRISASVAAASIVAKVSRDRSMRRLARAYPGYGFETNVGYGTNAHRDAIRALGPTPIHRRSFQGLRTGSYGDFDIEEADPDFDADDDPQEALG
jgi:ribonuclease HII